MADLPPLSPLLPRSGQDLLSPRQGDEFKGSQSSEDENNDYNATGNDGAMDIDEPELAPAPASTNNRHDNSAPLSFGNVPKRIASVHGTQLFGKFTQNLHSFYLNLTCKYTN